MHLILVSFNKKIAIRRILETVEGRGGRCAILPSVPSSKYPPSVSPPLSLCVFTFSFSTGHRPHTRQALSIQKGRFLPS